MGETHIAIFKGKAVRKTIHNNEWWFCITDAIEILIDSADPQGYLKDMRRRDEELAKGWGQIATPLEIATKGGIQKLNCANTEGLFRIIQSIPSPKAEPFNEIARNKDARGFHANKKVARDGGQVAGKARKDLEKRSGKKAVSRENYLKLNRGQDELHQIEGE